MNLTAAFLLGLLVGARRSTATRYRSSAPACSGAYTTFSTWALESHRLGEDGELRARRARTSRSASVLGVARGVGSGAARGRAVNEDVPEADRPTSASATAPADAVPRRRDHRRLRRATSCNTSLVMRGDEGFGAKHRLRTDRLLTLSEDLPLVAVAVDTRPRDRRRAGRRCARCRSTGLVTLERARMLTGRIPAVELPEVRHEATKLTVYVGRQERADGGPRTRRSSTLLHERGVAGATVLLGVDGTAHGARRRAAFFGRNAGVPLMIVSVGEGARDRRGRSPTSAACSTRPLLTLERVRVCKRDGAARRAARSCRETDAVGPRRLAEADGLRRRAVAPRRAPAPRPARPRAAHGQRRRRDEHPRHLGLPRRSRAARRRASGSCAAASRS